ncbi:hypothetical protein [Lysinibacillus fusiformis]|uniref:hypothetical protein n=1 Tax=Lysinibacillus fusiformis TaxID=28031 RepID=UPI00263A5582|nr:hypothetical protein [Lysinibacillus fusiformis]MDC6267992.1 hypothetical protein [Lysinibacillus sphaericus]MDN4967518.1 hypothetical protein [Lysinibacillus fusiformis]
MATKREFVHIDNKGKLSHISQEEYSQFNRVVGYVTSDSYGKIGIRQYNSGNAHIEPLKEGGKIMNEKDTTNTLFADIKADMREREERTRREISEREQRFEKQMEKYATDAGAREERISAAFAEREQRIISTLDKLEQKMDTNFNKMESMKTQNFWGIISISAAFIIGVAAMVITLLVAK